MTETQEQADKWAERAEALVAQLDKGYPESWRPSNPGETLVGIFQRLDRGYTSYGHAWVAVLASTRDGQEKSIWLLHTALRNQFKKAAPIAGELVAVRYDGKQKSANGVEYDGWTVRVDRKETPTDWSMVEGDHEEPAKPAASGDSWQDFTAVNEDDDIPF